MTNPAEKMVMQFVGEKAAEVALKLGFKTLAPKLALGIPVIGQVIFAASVLYDIISLFGKDSGKEDYDRKVAESRAQNAQEQQRVEREIQAKQELKQNCATMAADLTESITESVIENIKEIFSSMESTLADNLETANNKTSALALDIKTINKVLEECHSLKLKIVS